MAKIGYIQQFENYGSYESDKQWMQNYGCIKIVEEDKEQERLRPRLKVLLDQLTTGDELVISKFSNAVRGSRELGIFIEICRVGKIRIISIQDKIDTRNELFPETKTSDVLWMIAALPSEVVAMRKESAHVFRLKKGDKPITKAVMSRAEREKSVVSMYCHGQSIDTIWRSSGFKSRSSVFRILNKHGVILNRGNHSGPLGKRKKDSEEE